MEINLRNISVIYPNENSPELRDVSLSTGEFLHINIFDKKLSSIGITLDKKEVELLNDTLSLILKNNLIEELE